MKNEEPTQQEENLPVDPTALIADLNRSYGLQLAESFSMEQLESFMAEKVNHMIRTDFSGLVQWLYRIDVNEGKLRQLLLVNAGEDAGRIIARLLLERQWQKIQTRRLYSPDPSKRPQEWKDV
ncbi:MAG: hypothetical protein ABUM51_04705 [Bacteroidota bacterium]